MFIDNSAGTPEKDRSLPAKIAYILYLAGPFVGGLSWIGAVVIAYAYRDAAPSWLASHYRFQIRTFWIGLIPWLISLPLCLILIGFLPLGLLVLWVMIRAARGLRMTADGQAIPDPASLGFG